LQRQSGWLTWLMQRWRKQAREALVNLAGHPREQGSGITVTRYWKAGNVDYKKIPVLKGLDLSLFRGNAREEVRVTAAT